MGKELQGFAKTGYLREAKRLFYCYANKANFNLTDTLQTRFLQFEIVPFSHSVISREYLYVFLTTILEQLKDAQVN